MPAQPQMFLAPPALSGISTFDEASRLVLDYLEVQVPMGFWTVSRVIDGRQVYLDVTANELGLGVGDGPRWEDSLCHAMWVEGAPHVAPDVSRVPEYAHNAAARGLSVASYVGIPLFNADQTLFGTVCGIDTSVRGDGFVALTPQLELLGHLLSAVRTLDGRAVALSRQLESTLREAETDPLTGLRNRRAWQRACELEEARHHRLGDHASVVVLEVDGAGDAVLRRAAEVLRTSTRSTDVAARLGGDELAVLCPQTTEPEAGHLVDRLRTKLTAAGVPAAIGVATLEQTGTMADAEAVAHAARYVDQRRRRD